MGTTRGCSRRSRRANHYDIMHIMMHGCARRGSICVTRQTHYLYHDEPPLMTTTRPPHLTPLVRSRVAVGQGGGGEMLITSPSLSAHRAAARDEFALQKAGAAAAKARGRRLQERAAGSTTRVVRW